MYYVYLSHVAPVGVSGRIRGYNVGTMSVKG